MTTIVRELDAAAEGAWDSFVDAMPAATFFHRAGWRRVIEQGFGLKTHFLMAEADGAVTGILPLVHMRSLLFGSALVSTPFCVEGGAVAADRATADLLEAAAAALMDKIGVPTLELRSAGEVPAGWAERSDLYVSFRKPITGDDAANLKAIPRKQRAMVRKGVQLGLTSVVDHDADMLHRIYAHSVRNLGTPVFPRRYFRLLCEVFADCSDVVTIMDGDAPIASVLNFYYRDTVMPYYGGGMAQARSRAGNDFMYWEVMRRAAARGYRVFDFGRSKVGTGAFAFKEHWGFSAAPLQYRYRLKPGAAMPDNNPLNPKYRLMIAAWKRLPIPVANFIGPHIVRGLG